MNSKERVYQVFKHKEPDMVPVWCGALREEYHKFIDFFPNSDENFKKILKTPT